ncbi:MAG: transcription-repair coupling factor [Rhodospirillales bacterium]
MTFPRGLIEPETPRCLVGGVPEGADALVMAEIARAVPLSVFVARDDVSLARMEQGLKFFAPDVPLAVFPAWDTLPYDRVSPAADIVSRRLGCLAALGGDEREFEGIVLTTASAVLQRVPPRAMFQGKTLVLPDGALIEPSELRTRLEGAGYQRVDTVREPGEYATRGGLIDIFPAGATAPLRLDFFGDEIEQIRSFDAATQRTVEEVSELVIVPVQEFMLDDESISRFRTRYREQFGITGAGDALYEAVTNGMRYPGMEHWLPFFFDGLDNLFDYTGRVPIILDHQADAAVSARLELIDEYFEARRQVESVTGKGRNADGSPPYHPVPIASLFLGEKEFQALLRAHPGGTLSPFANPTDGDTGEGPGTLDRGGRRITDFAAARQNPDIDVFEAVATHITERVKKQRRVVVSAHSEGSADRLARVLGEHGASLRTVLTASDAAPSQAAISVAGFDHGFEIDDLTVITEQDILGERLSRPIRRKVRAQDIIADASTLGVGDLVVHADHGIGRFDGLHTIEAGGAPHDCLRLVYAGDDKLFLPVENIDLITRYGSEETGAQLDRLGGAAWQARKSKLKERIREMAAELIRTAAKRELTPAQRMNAAAGAYDEFASRFPFAETEDQQAAISAVLDDLASGRHADRLICGDVGFGKTEVALRAAFVAAMEGRQVAVVVPTTLLARQHFETFSDRFRGFPVRIAQLSRLVTAADAKKTKAELTDGSIDIVVGTHALLAKDIRFRDLALLVVDEEQHFGVAHKERLKQLKADVHVITLTATPIPRTLQLALSGVRDMSLIATPPVDRLAVRTYVLPFDPVIVREAVMREKYRGGQTFYVCPRIADLTPVHDRLSKLIPEVGIVAIHGQMPVRQIEDAIADFQAGKFDVLLATNIIESGLDMPRVNTIVIHRADRFGLAQLYQLRGRVGRSKVRAYAYLTLPTDRKLTPTAERRLEVMQTLDHLGAGFTLASHDLDIRGAGNLLGDEQSGHIREVGIELYQQMLEEAVAEARGGESTAGEEWSPQISIGLPVLIPDDYVSDLNVRMNIYKRIAHLANDHEIDPLAAELIDRFGPLPQPVEYLLDTVGIKLHCRTAGIAKLEAGPKGAILSFKDDTFSNPAGLVAFIQQNSGTAHLRPDHNLVYQRQWIDDDVRLDGVRLLVRTLADIAVSVAPKENGSR